MADDQRSSTNVRNLCDGCVVGTCELDLAGTGLVLDAWFQV